MSINETRCRESGALFGVLRSASGDPPDAEVPVGPPRGMRPMPRRFWVYGSARVAARFGSTIR